MIGTALLGLLGYEAATTLMTVVGVKALSFSDVNQRMLGLKQSKTLPIVDKKLKSMVGTVTKRERWIARKAVATINRISQYDAFKYAIVLGVRKLNEDMAKARTGSNLARWMHSMGRP